MPNSPFSLSSIFSWLKGFLSSMSSPIDGIAMDDVKVKEEGDGDIFSSLFVFAANPGEETEYEIGDNKQTYKPANELREIRLTSMFYYRL